MARAVTLSGPSSLDPGLWDEYALARSEIPGWRDDGTYNAASRLPSGAPSDHAVYPARAFDAGFNPANPKSLAAAKLFFQQMIGRVGIHYAIFRDQIWSTEQGLHPYTAGGHDSHVHVSEDQAGARGSSPSPAGARGSAQFRNLEQLWTDAGGSPALAETMAAIAMAENRGHPNPNAHNSTHSEDSRGYWQINVLAHPQYASWNLYNPATNARAAVQVQRSGGGLHAWSTYSDGSYKAYLPGAANAAATTSGTIRPRPADNSGGGLAGFFGQVGDAVGSGVGWAGGEVEGAASTAWRDFVGIVEGPLAIIKAAMFLFNPRNWLRMVEFVTGMGILGLGLLGLAIVLAARKPAVQGAASAAVALPGPAGAAARAVKLAGSSTQAKSYEATRRLPMKTRERGAKRQGERDERRSKENARLAKARASGRKRVRGKEREAKIRREIPDYDVIPY
jgi:hypothetical protein